MRPLNLDILAIVEELEGTSRHIEEALPEGMYERNLTKEDWNELDQNIYQDRRTGIWIRIKEQ